MDVAKQSSTRELANMIDSVFDGYEVLIEQQEKTDLVMIGIINLGEMLRQKWHAEKQISKSCKEQLAQLQSDSEAKNKDVKSLKAQLNDARAQIASLVEQKKGVEAERDEYERQIDLVKELLKNEYFAIPDVTRKKQLAFIEEPPSIRSRKGQKAKPSAQYLNGKMAAAHADDQDTCERSVDFDRSSDASDDPPVAFASVVRRSQKRAIKEELHTSRPVAKRSKDDVAVSEDHHQPTTPMTPRIKVERPSTRLGSNLNRDISFSENSIATLARPTTPIVNTPTRLGARTPASLMKSLGDLRTPSSAVQTRITWLSAGIPLEARTHTMQTKQILRSEYCDTCAEKIAFGRSAVRCTDCRYTSHVQCEANARLPCVPRVCPKTTFTLNDRIRLADYCTVMAPSLPNIIVHCVVELERRNVNFAGLYRVPGSEGRVNELLIRFMRDRATPNLSREDDMATITGLIKKFLALLEAPLVPPVSWQRFVDSVHAIDQGDFRGYDVLHSEILQLPMANRDTLSYLILHWQRVADAQDLTKMPIENLAKVLAPTVVGFGETAHNLDKLPLIERVMYRLLEADSDYWHQIFDSNLGAVAGPASAMKLNRLRGTPNSHSLLNAMRGNVLITQTPNRQLRKQKSKAKFFQSPW